MKGSALTVLSNLSSDKLYNYPCLVAALEACFGNAHQAELHQTKLKRRFRKQEEELAEDIKKLAWLAYPAAPPTMLELLATDRFIDALQDVDMWLPSKTGPPKKNQEALRPALKLVAFELVSQSRAAPVREANLEDDTTLSKAINDCIQQCADAFYLCPRREYPDAITWFLGTRNFKEGGSMMISQ